MSIAALWEREEDYFEEVETSLRSILDICRGRSINYRERRSHSLKGPLGTTDSLPLPLSFSSYMHQNPKRHKSCRCCISICPLPALIQWLAEKKRTQRGNIYVIVSPSLSLSRAREAVLFYGALPPQPPPPSIRLHIQFPVKPYQTLDWSGKLDIRVRSLARAGFYQFGAHVQIPESDENLLVHASTVYEHLYDFLYWNFILSNIFISFALLELNRMDVIVLLLCSTNGLVASFSMNWKAAPCITLWEHVVVKSGFWRAIHTVQ